MAYTSCGRVVATVWVVSELPVWCSIAFSTSCLRVMVMGVVVHQCHLETKVARRSLECIYIYFFFFFCRSDMKFYLLKKISFLWRRGIFDEFQIVSFTNKIQRLTSHFELHRKNYLSLRGLWKILGKRQRLLSYLAKKNWVCYKELISQLNIRESKTR